MQKLFYHGIILTMSEQYPHPEAVLIEGENIVCVGTREEVFARADKKAKLIDLKGRTLMPGFLEVYDSFIQRLLSESCFVDLYCYPEGRIKTIEQAVAGLKAAAAEKKGMIVGTGYDDTLCLDGRMLEARDLDRVSRQRPVLVLHRSRGVVMANTRAMELAGINSTGYVPEGGCVRRRSGVCVGVFEEAAAQPLFDLIDRQYLNRKLLPLVGKCCESYLQQGITVVCEGAATGQRMQLVKRIRKHTGFKARYLVCPMMEETEAIAPRIRGKHIINGPVRLVMDGCIRLFTAELSAPYCVTAPGRDGEADYSGYSRMSVEALRGCVERVLKSGRSFAIECCGDAAIDKVLRALEGCENLLRNKYKRNLLIGCELINERQLDKCKRLKLYPSFLAEAYDLGRTEHLKTLLGQQRKVSINPMTEAVCKRLPFSLHWHQAKGGEGIKPLKAVKNVAADEHNEQKLSVKEALKAITIYAAYQYRLEDILGSIEPGKKADFVALNKNPLTTDKEHLPFIQVERTWVDGRLVWSKKRRH